MRKGDNVGISGRKGHRIVDGAVGKANRGSTVRSAVAVRQIVQNGPRFRRTIQVVGRDMVTKLSFTRASLC